jgi:hypothetical protein
MVEEGVHGAGAVVAREQLAPDSRSATPATSAGPAREVKPFASATTCSLSNELIAFTGMVNLLGRDVGRRQPESSLLLRRTSPAAHEQGKQRYRRSG